MFSLTGSCFIVTRQHQHTDTDTEFIESLDLLIEISQVVLADGAVQSTVDHDQGEFLGWLFSQ